MLKKSEERFVGIEVDVSKAQLEIGVLPVEQFWKASNDDASRQKLAERLRELDPTLIVLESADGYETPVAIQLVAVGLPVTVINPRQVWDFAHAKGMRANADRIDARTLALLAQAVRPQVRLVKNQQSLELDELFMQRRKIVDMINLEKNRLTPTAKRVQKNVMAHTAHLAWLEKRLDDANSELKALIHRRKRGCAQFCVNSTFGKSVASTDLQIKA